MSSNKRYTVISTLTPSGPEYRIYDRVNDCTIEGGFDTQKWAESMAELMEEKYAIRTPVQGKQKPNCKMVN